MTQVCFSTPKLVRVGRAFSLTQAVDDEGQREFMGAHVYWF